MAKTVAVVGGGYGGTLVAEALDETADVILIDPRDAFVNVAASLRALTQPDWASNAFFPYNTLLRRGHHVRERAVSVDGSGVTLGDGSRIDADYIVLATGSSYSYPARPHLIDASVADALSDLRATHAQLDRAERVLILGAGPVGLELSGEIREVWPDKRITIVDRSAEVLPGYLQDVRDDLHRQLEALGVDLRLNNSIADIPPIPEGTLGSFTVTTTGGEDIEADIWFRSFGSRVNTAYLADGALTELSERNTVPVSAELNVVGYENVYALGDIADLTDPKMATWAQTQAGVVVENIRAQLEGRDRDAHYVPTTSQRIFLPLGSGAGVGQLPTPDGSGAPAPLHVVIDRKGRDLFTSRFAERFQADPLMPAEVAKE
jgi:NADH dehydrogenase FAD-containing subunit